MYFYLAISSLISLLIYNYRWYNITYSDEIKSITYIIGWYGLKSYTMIELKMKKIYNKCINVICDSNKPYISKIILLNNGNEIMNTKKNNNIEETINYIENTNNKNSYDFIIYECVIPEKNTTYVRLTNNLESIYKVNENNNEIKSINYNNLEKSEVQFLSPTIVLKDNKYVFIPNDDDNIIKIPKTIYLVDNILFHKSFIKWYLKKHHNVELEEHNNKEYSVQFFDNNMDFITISNKENIILEKTDYQRITHSNPNDNIKKIEDNLYGMSQD